MTAVFDINDTVFPDHRPCVAAAPGDKGEGLKHIDLCDNMGGFLDPDDGLECSAPDAVEYRVFK